MDTPDITTPIVTYSAWEGPSLCEECAVRAYKEANPLWNIPVLRDPVQLFIYTT